MGKRNRIALAPEYVERDIREILDPFDLGALVAELPGDSATARPRATDDTSRGQSHAYLAHTQDHARSGTADSIRHSA